MVLVRSHHGTRIMSWCWKDSEIMRSALITIFPVTALVSATQIVFMDLDEVLPMAGSVMIAEVVSMEAFEGDGWCSGDFILNTLDMLRGDAEPGVEISCTYNLNLPRECESASGTVMWVSPLETGSGYEFFVSPGDTVIALLGCEHADTSGCHTLLRIEPLDMLADILDEMDIAALGGVRLCQTDQVVQAGETYTYRFEYSSGKWRCLDLIERPMGTAFTWEWSNISEWQDMLTVKTDTLEIVFDVEDVQDIHYSCVIPGMPDRWMRLYVCRILGVETQ
jgi:hypothetical protein